MAHPEQIYQHGAELYVYVRDEVRKGVDGVLVVGVKARTVYTRWIPVNEAIPGKLVNDVGGRVEADLATKDREFVEKENRALRFAINSSLQSVQRAKLKRVYEKEMKK